MLLPPRPLPLSDRLYLYSCYQPDSVALDRLERLELRREEIVTLLDRLHAPLTGLIARTAIT